MRLPALLLVSLAMTACTTLGTPAASPAMPVTLAAGQALPLPDRSVLRYVGTRDDSRCPPKVMCIRAGEATVLFDHTPAGGVPTRAQVVVPDAPATTVGSWRLTVEALAHGDAPDATVRVARP